MAHQSANEDIRDELIRRQMQTIRLASGLGLRMQRLLRSVESELQRDLDRRLQALASPRVRFGKTTTARLKSMNRSVRRILRPAYDDLRKLTRDELLELAALETQFVASAITASLPVIVNLDLPDAGTLRSAVLSKPFQGKLLRQWMQQLETGDRRRINDAVQTGLALGEPSAEIGRRVFGTTRSPDSGTQGITRRAAQGIAQTAVTHVTNQARQALYLANKELIPEELYVATLDSRTTRICSSLDGKRFPTGTGPIPPVHFNCRSTRVPAVAGAQAGTRPANAVTAQALEGLKGQERRAAVQQLVGQVPATETYQVFLRKQTVAFQNENMGVTKARLFRRGGLELDKFVTPQGRELTIAELRSRQPAAFQKAGLQ
ncbi:MAG: minor capsid protein [Dehalococcoidales bacterium]